MKTNLLFALMLTGSATIAQHSEKYWVVETNKFDKGKSIVRIYDTSNVLLHEETLNRDINIYSNRDKKFLKRMVADFSKRDTTIAKSPAHKQAGKRLRRVEVGP
jgi:hypothetical protein